MGFVADITTQNSEHKDILILDRTKCWTYTKTQENMSPSLKSTGDQDEPNIFFAEIVMGIIVRNSERKDT